MLPQRRTCDTMFRSSSFPASYSSCYGPSFSLSPRLWGQGAWSWSSVLKQAWRSAGERRLKMISSTLAPDSTLLRLVWQFTALARGVSCCYLFVSVYVCERQGMRESERMSERMEK